MFAAPGHGAGAVDVPGYAEPLRGEAQRLDTGLGEPRWDDDRYGDKLDLLCEERVPVVSFTFGCPTADDVQRLHERRLRGLGDCDDAQRGRRGQHNRRGRGRRARCGGRRAPRHFR